MKFRGLPKILFFQNFVWNLNIYLSSSSSKVEYKKNFSIYTQYIRNQFFEIENKSNECENYYAMAPSCCDPIHVKLKKRKIFALCNLRNFYTSEILILF